MSWRDAKWRYVNAAETAKPGYLEKRFKEIRHAMEAQRKASSKVTPILRKERKG